MQALVSFVKDSGDTLKSVKGGNHKFVFLDKEHLILVTVSNTFESEQQLQIQMNYAYNQIISILTLSQLQRAFQQRHNYDLRRLLTGAEKFLSKLLVTVESDPSCLLGAAAGLPLENTVRESIANVIAQNVKHKVKAMHFFFYRNCSCISPPSQPD